MARARPRKRWLLRSLAAFVLSVAGFTAASIIAGGPRELFADDPLLSDYTWLRQQLDRGEEQSDLELLGLRTRSRQMAARTLERAIRYSRASARRTAVHPIPPAMRESLKDYFPEDLLDDVRWAFPNQYLDLGTAIAWYNPNGGAITLDETIIFASREGAESEYLWAHELTHAMQFDELGVRDFARLYTTHAALLEKQAHDNGQRVANELRAKRRAAQG